MPPLRHKVGNEYSPMTSEVIAWMVQQPDIREYLFKRSSNKNSLIVYDPDAGTWQGKDYKPAPTRKLVF